MPAKNPKGRGAKPGPSVPTPATPAAPRTYAWWLWSGMPTFEGVCDALAFQYAALDELLQPVLAAHQTVSGPHAGLDPWRTAVLLARLTTAAEEVVAVTQGPVCGAPAVDAVDWFRSPATVRNWAASEAIARSAAGRAMQSGIGRAAAGHRAATAVAAAVLRSGGPDRALGGVAGGLDLAEFAVTRLVPAVVYGLELAAELGRPGYADPRAAHLVSGFLAAVAERAAAGPGTAPITVDGQGSLIVLAGGRGRARIPAVEWIQAATSRPPVRLSLPRSHDWLAAELPLGA
ncbi:hypothetical protein ABH926_003165 [Catenulispora sp. GP43]|uniref:hypothetical protein n=1 Tax=Catenulispora sp. GP43 TaxID=3156263 RepID=UPI003513A411